MTSKKLKEKVIKSSLFLCAAFSIFVVIFIFTFLMYNGYPAVAGFFMNGISWFDQGGLNSQAGIGLVILLNLDTTVYLALGATALAVMVGVPCAIYMAEFADMRIRNLTKTTLEVLDGFPSIVIGLIGFTLLSAVKNPYSFSGYLHSLAGWDFLGSDLYAWLILMIMAFPVIATLSEDAFRAVSQDLREASLGIGATKWQTTKEVLLPSAMPRIITAILLALAASMGEMVAIYFVLGGTVTPTLLRSPTLIFNPLVQGQTLSINMEASYNGSLDGLGLPGPAVYFLGITLFVIVGLLNIAVRVISARTNKTTE